MEKRNDAIALMAIVEDPNPKSPDKDAIIAMIESIGVPLGIFSIVLAFWGLFDRHLYDWMFGRPTGAILGDTATYIISGLWIFMGILFIAVAVRAKRSGTRT
jgi:hypothetical protein